MNIWVRFKGQQPGTLAVVFEVEDARGKKKVIDLNKWRSA